MQKRKQLLSLLYIILKQRKSRRLRKLKRKVWVKDIFKDRELEGAFTLTIKNLRRFNDRENHFRYVNISYLTLDIFKYVKNTLLMNYFLFIYTRYLRMSPERFDCLLELVTPIIRKKDTKFRKSIPPCERLALTLRFLATGESQISLSFQFKIGRSTVSKILAETSRAIYSVLSEKYMRAPSTSEEWKAIASDFEEKWNMPHVIGAIDGKHVRLKCPKNTGSYYHNYKGFFSLVLLAICDANYCFTLFDLGQYGSNNDSGVLLNSNMSKCIEENSLNIPESEALNGCWYDPLPYFLVGDEIFPLKEWLMRPFPGKLTEQERIFNYRLSRARRVIENCFGILAARWRIFSTPIEASVDHAQQYTLACMSLHNYLRQTDNARYCPSGFIDQENASGEIKNGEWRKLIEGRNGAITHIQNVRGSRYKKDAIEMRNSLMDYLKGVGQVSWQLGHVRRI